MRNLLKNETLKRVVSKNYGGEKLTHLDGVRLAREVLRLREEIEDEQEYTLCGLNSITDGQYKG